MSSLSSRNIGQPIRPLLNPIAIRPEHIAPEETALCLRPKADTRSATDYTIENAVTGSTVFSATGKKYGSSPGREFRDSTGLPLFELRRVGLSRRPFRVRLPGDKEKDLVSLCMRGPSMKLKLDILQNRATATTASRGNRKGEDEEKEETVNIEVRRSTGLSTFDVLAGDHKVADIRESAEQNDTMGHLLIGPFYQPPPRRVLDIRVAEGLDMSIVSDQ